MFFTTAKQLFDSYKEELGISLSRFDEMVYLPFEDEHQFKDNVAEGVINIVTTSVDIHERIRTGRNVTDWASFSEVLGESRKAYPAPAAQGSAIFCTGLSGAGKSTIAKVLFSKMLEIGERPVTLLDGDIVRHNLSSELTFSKEYRTSTFAV